MERSLLWLFYILEMPQEFLGSMTSQNPWFTRFGKVHQKPREKPKAWKGKKVRTTRIGYDMAVWVSHLAPKHRTQSYLEFSYVRDSPPTNAVRLSDGRMSRVCPDERAEFCKVCTTNRWLTGAWGLFQSIMGVFPPLIHINGNSKHKNVLIFVLYFICLSWITFLISGTGRPS
jgi:hypothetical protein